MKIKKKQIIIIGAALVVVAAAGVIFAVVRKGGSSGSDAGNSIYVDSVAELCGLGSGNGLTDRFSGIVEPQKTWDIQVSSDKTVEEILVKEGDEVKVGDDLFTYNTEEMEDNLAQAEIELDRLANEIAQTNEQIASLKKEKASAGADAQLSYTTQINTAENEVKRNEYEQKSKQMEIEKLKNSIANATVTSELDGVVKSINASGSSDVNSMTGETEAFMTILATGDFRVKGTVNEQNMSAIVEGQAVIVHSRVNDTTWAGTLTSVDLENPEKNDSMMYYSSDGSTDSSSNYPFYVELESAEGLMLGQHVYIEMDYGQNEEREGIWLDSYYIIQEDDQAYVWAANSKDKMEKRSVTLGEFDEEMQQYQIVDGLTEDDYIAFPDESIKEGDNAVKNVDQTSDFENMGGDIQDFDGESYDDSMYEEEYEEYEDYEDYPEEGMYDGDEDLGGEMDGEEEDMDSLTGGMNAADIVNDGLEETE